MGNITIECYKDEKFGSKIGAKWTGKYDPCELKLNYKNEFKCNKAIGVSPPAAYSGEKEKKMTFPLIIDNSWMAELQTPGTKTPISTQVKDFIKKVHNVNSESHNAPYLKITLGGFIFSGQSLEIEVEYKMFNAKGKPQRADVKLTILETEAVSVKKKEAGLKSPDLTRSVLINEGDSLAGLSQKYYDTPTYYMELARFNRLPHLRALKPGMRIIIPPLES